MIRKLLRKISGPALFAATAFGVLMLITSSVPVWAVLIACALTYAALAFMGDLY